MLYPIRLNEYIIINACFNTVQWGGGGLGSGPRNNSRTFGLNVVG